MFESANLKHHVDKAAYKREAAKLREALLDAQYDLKQNGRFPVLILIGRRRRRRQERDGQPAQRVDGSAPHPHQRVLRSPSDEERERPAHVALLAGAAAQGQDRHLLRRLAHACRSSTGSSGEISEGEFARDDRRDPALREDAAATRACCCSSSGSTCPRSQQRKRLKAAGDGPEDALARDRARLGVLQALRQVRQGLRAVPAQDQRPARRRGSWCRAPTRATARSPSGRHLLAAMRERLDEKPLKRVPDKTPADAGARRPPERAARAQTRPADDQGGVRARNSRSGRAG